MTNGTEDVRGTLSMRINVIWKSSTRKIILDHGGLKMTWDEIAFNSGLYPSHVLITCVLTMPICSCILTYIQSGIPLLVENLRFWGFS